MVDVNHVRDRPCLRCNNLAGMQYGGLANGCNPRKRYHSAQGETRRSLHKGAYEAEKKESKGTTGSSAHEAAGAHNTDAKNAIGRMRRRILQLTTRKRLYQGYAQDVSAAATSTAWMNPAG